MSQKPIKFNYGELDANTADFLRKKESNMREIVGKAYTELGKELYEAQQKLAKQGSKYEGVFEKWYTSIGFKRQKVYDLINRYNLLRNLEEVSEIELIEDLPVSLTYEIAKPSAESTPAKAAAKQAVLDGDITTRKEYLDLIKKLEDEERRRKEQEQRAQQAEAERDIARKSEQIAIRQAEELADKPPEIKTEIKYVEVKDELAEKELEKYRNMFGDISLYENEGTKITNVQELTSKLMLFNKDVRRLLERFAHLEHYKDDITVISGEAREDFESSIKALEKFCEAFEGINGNTNSESVIIDVEYSN